MRALEEWARLGERLRGAVPPHDPHFAPLHPGELRDLFHPAAPATGRVVVVGPGAALAGVDEVWLAGFPKRLGLELVRAGSAGNLGGAGPGTEQRLVFVDWPLLERHHQRLVERAAGFVDLADPARPRFARGDDLRASLAGLARRPFRTVPSFLPGPWGGQWLRRRLGIQTDAPNLAWSYELIAPEAGISLGGLEVPLELLLGLEADAVLGARGARPLRPRASRSASTTSTRSRAGISRSSATRPRSTPRAVRPRLHAAGELLRRRHDAGRRRLPRAPRGCRRRRLPSRRARGGGEAARRSTRAATCRPCRPSGTGST